MIKISISRINLIYALFLTILMCVTGCAIKTQRGDLDVITDGKSPGFPEQQKFSIKGELVVFAADALTKSFSEIGSTFEDTYPEANITFNFGGSQILARQIQKGAPVDVFASANQKYMDDLINAGLIDSGAAQIFAKNNLTIIVSPSKRMSINTLKDLAQPGLKLVVAAKEVPVGDFTVKFLEKASSNPDFGIKWVNAIKANIVSYESDVSTVQTKIDLGEADAGIVFGSNGFMDKTPGIKIIEIPYELNVIALFPVGMREESNNKGLATAFIEYVMSEKGQDILYNHGFLRVK